MLFVGGDGGYSAQSIQRWCNQKILVGFKIRGTLTIPRLAVVEFMSGDRATAIVRKSSKHLDLLRTYAQDCHEGAMTITYYFKIELDFFGFVQRPDMLLS